MLVKPITTTLYGKQVILATIPVDPRDLFYGDYVILDLEIEELDITLVEPTLVKKIEGDKYYEYIPVYVSLQKGETGIYQVSSVSEQKPNGLFVKGKMSPYLLENTVNEDGKAIKTVMVDYGIDRFYVEEDTGLELESLARKGQVLVTVKIHKGYPIVSDIQGVQSLK
jgi:uncharacterized membrane-anchored protein